MKHYLHCWGCMHTAIATPKWVTRPDGARVLTSFEPHGPRLLQDTLAKVCTCPHTLGWGTIHTGCTLEEGGC